MSADTGGVINAREVTIGIREESWPKETGYVYARFAPDSREVRVLDCDLKALGAEEADALFAKVMSHLSDRELALVPEGHSVRIRSENLSPLARSALRNALSASFVLVD